MRKTLPVILFLLAAALAAFPPCAVAQKPQPPNPLAPAPRKEAEAPPAPSTGPAPQMTASDVAAFLDGLVPLQIERSDIAGCVVVVVKDGKVIFAKGYGYADADKKTPVSAADTLFRVGSISKLFTWTAVMQLVEEGKLDLDRDVNAYIDFKIPPTYARPITLRNLMTHTPGFEETLKQLFAAKPEQMQPLAEYMRTHQPARIFPPGEVPAYSNYGAALAGYIVQRVSGEKYEDYIAEHIFKPLGMTHASFVQPLPAALKPLMSQGYQLGSGKAKEFELIPAAPAGALSVSGEDIARFMLAHLEGGEYNGQRILRAETVQTMHAPQFSLSPSMNAMALGFYEESSNGHRIIGHGGDTMWFHSDLHLVQDQDLGFFISSNSAGKGGFSLRSAVWQKFLGRYYPYQPPAATAPASKMDDAKAVSGLYMTSRRSETTFLRIAALLGEMKVTANSDGTIENESKDFRGQPKKYEEIAPLLYRDKDGQEKIAFLKNPAGGYKIAIDFPAMEFATVRWYEGQNFLAALIVGSAAVFLLTIVLWIVTAFVRRHYRRRAQLRPSNGDPGPRVLVRLVCILDLAAWGAWAGIMAYGSGDITRLTPALDPWLHLAQALTILAVLATVVPLYNAARTWGAQRWWWTKVWDTVIALAALAFVYVSILGHLWNWNVKY